MRLTGFEAIEYAEKEGLTLNKAADRIDGEATGLSIAESEAIATDRPELIWIVVPQDKFYGSRRTWNRSGKGLASNPRRFPDGQQQGQALSG